MALGSEPGLPLCWICRKQPADTAEHKVKASDVRQVAPTLTQDTPVYLQINSTATNKRIGAASARALAFPPSICARCNGAGTQPYDEAWRKLSKYLHSNWQQIVRRGAFDLSKAFPGDVMSQALNVHLFFVKLLGCKLLADKINVDLASFSSALLNRSPHSEITLLIANSNIAAGQFLFYESDVSVLRRDEEVYSAMWMNLVHPVAVKICYVKNGAPVCEPDGFPWHPSRQRKIVKLSPYKGDTRATVARRDLKM
jgi:hypothetical protein